MALKESPSKKAEILAVAGGTLLSWYDANKRDLPWRGSNDPYAIWVSEILLQQTTVAAVLDRYPKFLERFPNIETLAAASEEEVLAELQGLGYYRRFRAMRRAALEIVEGGGGKLPEDVAAWKALPGIGDYTAGAIVSIAFNQAHAAVDGNVVRVLTRLLALPGIHESLAAKRKLGEEVLTMMPAGCASRFNQALFDLGATVCVPKDPRCETCPIRSSCLARTKNEVHLYPERPIKKAMVDVKVAVALIEENGSFLMTRRAAKESRMPGFRELPEIWVMDENEPRDQLHRLLAERFNGRVAIGDELAEARHTITHHRLFCTLYSCQLAVSSQPGGEWVNPANLDEVPTSTITKKLLRRLASEL